MLDRTVSVNYKRSPSIARICTLRLCRNRLGKLIFSLCCAKVLARPEQSLLPEKCDFCIVGAGPGGLQVGQFMLSRGWQYKIFERHTRPASFFTKFPIHRQLISLNKRYTGRDNFEFNLRHDWNSLLDGPDGLSPVTNRSELRFPNADVLVEYLSDFAIEQENAGNIHYSAEVNLVARSSSRSDGLELKGTQEGRNFSVQCQNVIMATGVGVPNVPKALLANGWGSATSYADMPSSSAMTGYREYSKFANKRALVVGLGNAGLETADALASTAAYVHIMPGREGKIRTPLFAHETRYVGDIRMMRASIFDSYLLKSLDGGMNGQSISAESFALAKCLDQWCVLSLDPSKQTVVYYFYAQNKRARKFAKKLEKLGYVMGHMAPVQAKDAAVFASVSGMDEHRIVEQTAHDEGRQPRGKVSRRVVAELHGVYLNRSILSDEALVLAIAQEFADTETPFPLIYDIVVRATGWKHDTSIYASNVKPKLQPSGKFPVVSCEYQAVGVPGLYFAGAQGHGRDHRKSAGGFIHGFRYTARALVRMLDTKISNAWPGVVQFKLGSKFKKIGALTKHILQRIDTASGPYQMVHVLGDGFVLTCTNGSVETVYFEEMPLEYFNRRFAEWSRFFWTFGYGQQRQAYTNSINGGTKFNALLWHYPGKCPGALPVDVFKRKNINEIASRVAGHDMDGFQKVLPKELLVLRETLHTEWNKPLTQHEVSSFVKVRANAAVSGKEMSMHDHVFNREELRTPKVTYHDLRWGHGEVDLHIQNIGSCPVRLRRIQVGAPAQVSNASALKDSAKLDEVATAELDLLSLDRGEGKRIFTQENERWEATTTDGRMLERRTVDCAFGIVQDWLVNCSAKKKRRKREEF